ncbi:MAG: hypothetical protein Q8S73_36665 [Deltaproteobacteria bacterium]|nr:hypothetical protein [Myxococcales bacterium]MDP3219692.1 hypothetical protein [Deltaproteobacteria bacterium]
MSRDTLRGEVEAIAVLLTPRGAGRVELGSIRREREGVVQYRWEVEVDDVHVAQGDWDEGLDDALDDLRHTLISKLRQRQAKLDALLGVVPVTSQAMADAVAAARADERDACAAACRDVASDMAEVDCCAETADACAEAIEGRYAAPAKPEGFYILSLKWSRGESLVWWRPGAAGYTLRLDDAGVFTADEADAACPPGYDDSAAIPVADALTLCSRVVLDSDRGRVLAVRRPARAGAPTKAGG